MNFSLHPGDLAFGVALLFLFGIFAVSLGWNLYILFIAATLGALMVLFFKQALWREGAVFIAAIVLGVFYYHFYFRARARATNLPIGREAAFTAIVNDEPQPSNTSLLFSARAESPYAGALTIFAPPTSDVAYGDLLRVRGVIRSPPTEDQNPAVFSAHITLLARHRGFFLREWMINLKRMILDKFNELLSNDEAALLGGITFGSKQNFKPELKRAMALSGLTHLVAISGYNITIVILAAGQVFGRFFSRRATFYAAIVLLMLFMFMVGGAASGVRAAIMGFLALIAREAGRMFSMRNAVTITAAFMVLFDPHALTRNMSFILSFVSLLGIVYLGPPLKKLLRYNDQKGLLDWKENAVTTLSAQFAVMPILMNTFGQFSASAVIANILVLGTIPFTMFLGALLALLAFVSGHLAFFAAQLTGFLLAYQLFIMRTFAAIAIPLPFVFDSQFAMFFYYALLATFIFFYGRSETR